VNTSRIVVLIALLTLAFGTAALLADAAQPVASGNARVVVPCPAGFPEPCSFPEPDWARPAAFSAVRSPNGDVNGQLALHSTGELIFPGLRVKFFTNLHVDLDCAITFGDGTAILSGEITSFSVHVWQRFDGEPGPSHFIEDGADIIGDDAVLVVEDNGPADDRTSTVEFCEDLAADGYPCEAENACEGYDPENLPDRLQLRPLASGNVTVWD
jgi:hypothetical protein